MVTPRRCDLCKKPATISFDGHQERYCRGHREQLIQDMKRTGYLEDLPEAPWEKPIEGPTVVIVHDGQTVEELINADRPQ